MQIVDIWQNPKGQASLTTGVYGDLWCLKHYFFLDEYIKDEVKQWLCIERRIVIDHIFYALEQVLPTVQKDLPSSLEVSEVICK